MKPSLLTDGEPKHPMWIKPAVLLVLCVQNSSHALLTRYSQGILKEKYSSTEVVLVGEVIKLVVSGYLSVTDSAETDAVGKGLWKLYWLTKNSRKVIVLVILYSVANILSYYALARVDASVYTVCLQLKIFSTAAFAVLMLGRSINITKWRALMLLVLGCILVASPTFNKAVDCAAEFQRLKYDKKGIPVGGEVDYDNTVSMTSSVLGVATIMIMVTISGYSAIYFEQMLKTSALQRITIWERNFQLALYSIALLCAILFYEAMNDGEEELNIVFFRGWTINTVLIAFIQAAGGLLVAAALKYADAVLKTLATSGAIVMSAVLGYVLLGAPLDIFVAIGCLSVILAIFNYTFDASS